MDLEEKLEEFIERMEDEEKSEATIKKYKANINSFIEYTKDKELNKKTVKEFKNKLDTVDEFLANTTNGYLIILNKFFKFIDRKDLCVKIIKQQKRFSLEYSLSKSDYHRLLRMAKKCGQ